MLLSCSKCFFLVQNASFLFKMFLDVVKQNALLYGFLVGLGKTLYLICICRYVTYAGSRTNTISFASALHMKLIEKYSIK